MDRSVVTSSFWETLPWSKFHKKVFRLQSKIYDAMRKKDFQKTLKLQKLLIQDRDIHYVAVKKIIENKKHLVNCVLSSDQPIDFKNNVIFLGKINTEIKDGMYLSSKLIFNATVNDTKKVLPAISKENQIVQLIWTLALEPVYKAFMVEKESEVRRKVGLIHLPYEIKKTLRKPSTGWKKKILKIDFTTCCSSINHKVVIKKLILPLKHKLNIYRALQMGFIDLTSIFHLPNYKVDRFSLLLVNMVFYELENLPVFFRELKQNPFSISKLCSGFRYGLHLLYIFEIEETLMLDYIKRLSSLLGIHLKFRDIRIVNVEDGFDFLGWRFSVRPNSNVFIYPNVRNWLSYKSKIKDILRSQKNEIHIRIQNIKHIAKKWHIYHSNCEIYPLKSKLYKLNLWSLRYLRVSTNMSKKDRQLSIKKHV